MTTEQMHEELRECGFYKIGTGGGCDALVKTLWKDNEHRTPLGEVMLTAFEDAAVPEADDQVHITIRMESDESAMVRFVLSPEQTLAFARSVSCEAA